MAKRCDGQALTCPAMRSPAVERRLSLGERLFPPLITRWMIKARAWMVKAHASERMDVWMYGWDQWCMGGRTAGRRGIEKRERSGMQSDERKKGKAVTKAD
eukprot:378272-Rhodomonas_salina.3